MSWELHSYLGKGILILYSVGQCGNDIYRLHSSEVYTVCPLIPGKKSKTHKAPYRNKKLNKDDAQLLVLVWVLPKSSCRWSIYANVYRCFSVSFNYFLKTLYSPLSPFLLSRCQILCEKKRRRVSFSSLGLIKPKIYGESGSIINADRQSQVSGRRTTTEFMLTSRPNIDEQVIIPLNNVVYSIYPSIIHDGSSFVQTLDAVLHSPASEMSSTIKPDPHFI